MVSIISEQLSNILVPSAGEKVYKDECIYSCDTPVSIYVVLVFWFRLIACSIHKHKLQVMIVTDDSISVISNDIFNHLKWYINRLFIIDC